MSNSRLPTNPGETPTKVVLEGTDPGDPAARQLYNELRGQVARFQGKARQSREISGQPQLNMQQALPGGGRMRYNYNNGQETLRIEVNPTRGESVEVEPEKRLLPITPVLAIDVLFDPAQFRIGEIHSTDTTTIYHPGEPGGVEVVIPASSYSYVIAADNPGTWAEDYAETTITRTFSAMGGNTGTVRGPNDETRFSSTGDAVAHLNSRIAEWEASAAEQIAYYEANGYFGLTNTATVTYRVASFTGPIELFGPWVFQAYYETLTVESSSTALKRETPPTPPYTTEKKRQLLETRDYLDVLPVVGLRVDGTRPYEALSTEKAKDSRLVSLLDNERVTVERTIAFNDPDGGDRFYGAGFCAQPRDPAMPGVDPAELEIEVWIASANVAQRNEPPGRTSSQWGVDDPDMIYEPSTELSFTIRAREFGDGGYQIVKVETDAQGKIEKFEEGQRVSTSMPTDAQHIEWRFAAAGAWTDSGQEPAQPETRTSNGIPTMGALLDELHMTVEVDPARVPERTVPRKPTHNGTVEQMTRVAVIRWKPPAQQGAKGSAEITPA